MAQSRFWGFQEVLTASEHPAQHLEASPRCLQWEVTAKPFLLPKIPVVTAGDTPRTRLKVPPSSQSPALQAVPFVFFCLKTQQLWVSQFFSSWKPYSSPGLSFGAFPQHGEGQQLSGEKERKL